MIRLMLLAICFVVVVTPCTANEKRHSAEGMIVAVDAEKNSILISCKAIPGYRDAMEMPLEVRSQDTLNGLHVGLTVQFTLVENGSRIFADDIRVVKNVNGEAEPVEAGRLEFLTRAVDPAAADNQVKIGQNVPDFVLVDQERQSIRLSQFRGKVVALTFGYSRCPNPNYCFRLSNNLAQLQRRFADCSLSDLILLTVVIDPANDQAETLTTYAKAWKADPVRWHFLTGSVEQVRGVAAIFGVDFWSDEGFLTHAFHTVVIDRGGLLAANLEGNQFTTKQLGDLVESVLRQHVGNRAGTRWANAACRWEH
jgi:protein SCO1